MGETSTTEKPALHPADRVARLVVGAALLPGDCGATVPLRRPAGLMPTNGFERAFRARLRLPSHPVHLVMTKTSVFTVLTGLCLAAAPVAAQQMTITGKVTDEQGTALRGASIVVKGTGTGTTTNGTGDYTIRAAVGRVLQFRYIGAAPEERVVGADSVINVQLRRNPTPPHREAGRGAAVPRPARPRAGRGGRGPGAQPRTSGPRPPPPPFQRGGGGRAMAHVDD